MLDCAVENNSDAVMYLQDDRFIECNKKSAEIFGCDLSEILDKEPWKFSPEKQPSGISSRNAALQKIHAALNGEKQQFTWMHRRLDGTPFFAEVTLRRIQDHGRVLLEATVRDLTRKIRIEKQCDLKDRIDAIKTILFSIDHEFRTNLQSSLLAASILYGSTESEDSKKILQSLIITLRKLIVSADQILSTRELMELGCEDIWCQQIEH